MTEEAITFVGSQGHQLAGRLHRPAGPARGSILLAHCFTCSKDLHTMTRLARGFADAGYVAMRFDFTGIGESGGDFSEKTLSGNVSDLTRGATQLIGRGFGPCGLIGHSLGGAAAILAAHRLKTVRSVVTIGAPSDAGHVRHLLADQAGRTVTIAGRSFELDEAFVLDLEVHDVLTRVSQLGRPYLVVHARDDDVVRFEHAEALYRAAAPPKELMALESGGHLLTPRDAADAALAAILDWFARTL